MKAHTTNAIEVDDGKEGDCVQTTFGWILKVACRLLLELGRFCCVLAQPGFLMCALEM